jgi:hypothetical protein
MKRFTLTCSAVLATVAAVAGVGPAGWGTAGAEAATQDDDLTRLTVNFHVADGITLGKQTVLKNENTFTLDPLVDVGGRGAGYESTYNPRNRLDVSVSWPVLQGRDAAVTGYTLTCKTGAGAVLSIECSVSGPDKSNPFHASVNQRGGEHDWDVHVTDDRVDRLAEASGAVRTDGSVSLLEPLFGSYYTESEMRLDGASAVPVNSSTQFDAVLRPSDRERSLREPDTARMTFVYAMYADGRPAYSSDGKRLYVRGNVWNDRSGVFLGGSSCEIGIADGTVVENSGYTCSMQGAHPDTGVKDGRVHYITDFTVGRNA